MSESTDRPVGERSHRLSRGPKLVLAGIAAFVVFPGTLTATASGIALVVGIPADALDAVWAAGVGLDSAILASAVVLLLAGLAVGVLIAVFLLAAPVQRPPADPEVASEPRTRRRL